MLSFQGGLRGPETMQTEIEGFLATAPNPTSAQIADFLKLYPDSARGVVAQTLVANGVAVGNVSGAMNFLDVSGKFTWKTFWGIASIASAAYSGYHGMKRNDSLGWGAWWFLMGGLFPVAAPLVTVYKNRK